MLSADGYIWRFIGGGEINRSLFSGGCLLADDDELLPTLIKKNFSISFNFLQKLMEENLNIDNVGSAVQQ